MKILRLIFLFSCLFTISSLWLPGQDLSLKMDFNNSLLPRVNGFEKDTSFIGTGPVNNLNYTRGFEGQAMDLAGASYQLPFLIPQMESFTLKLWIKTTQPGSSVIAVTKPIKYCASLTLPILPMTED